MASIDFPSSPSDGQTLTVNNVIYAYNETKGIWLVSNSSVSISSTNVEEGSKLFYTDQRVYANISPLLYTDEDTYANISPLLNTNNVTESDNLYFTNTRAVQSLTGGNNIAIDSNGLISSTVVEGATTGKAIAMAIVFGG